MNEIFERCSIRRYTDQKIEKEKLDLILKAAFCAPSAKNAQPWEFLVIEDLEELKKMSTFTRLPNRSRMRVWGLWRWLI